MKVREHPGNDGRTGNTALKRFLLPWAQEVGGSNPLAPINSINQLGGSDGPALFHVHADVHTDAVWPLTRKSYSALL